MALGPEKEFDFISRRQSNLIPFSNGARYIDLIRLQSALRLSWGADTVVDWERDKWTKVLPSFGQCAVTALVVQDFFGGKLVKDPENDHYWNIFDDGTECDLSREQFAYNISLLTKEERTREDTLTSERSIKARTLDRYNILRERVRRLLGK